jgi:hypothetical protein
MGAFVLVLFAFGMIFSVEIFLIMLTFFWFRRTMKFDTLGGKDGFERNKFVVPVIVRVNEANN